MSTVIRPEISKSREYWLEEHRYYELKHFCLQYPIWKETYEAMRENVKTSGLLDLYIKSNLIGDPTGDCVEARMFYSERIEMVEVAAEATDSEIGKYILKGVTEGLSYDKLNEEAPVPCGKDKYYKLYRKFFWLLSKMRG